MKPIEVFEQNFRNAEAMLSLHKLLIDRDIGKSPDEFKRIVHECFSIPTDEETVIILNEMLHALVRDCASLKKSFFAEKNLNLLLRQSIVATCSAMDVYCNDILKENVMTVIHQKGTKSPNKLKEIEMTLGEFLSISEYADQDERIKQIILSKFDKFSLGSPKGISDTIEGYLGIENYWKKVSDKLGKRQQDIKNEIDDIVKRRNDIIHRGDRKKNLTEIDPEIQNIEYSWTYSHVHAIKALILTTDEIIKSEFTPSPPQEGVPTEVPTPEVRES
jgi:hypothetical protein